MRRDLDLYRTILLAMEGSSRPLDASVLADGEHDRATVAEHVLLMSEDGLVEATCSRDMSGSLSATVSRIKGPGYDYLDAVRDERVWSKVRLSIAQTVSSVPLEVAKAMAVKALTSLVGGAS